MTGEAQPLSFFIVGGTLDRDASSYIDRAADEEMLCHTMAGEYCNVLTARQMGKSSLMVRTAKRLNERGVRTVIIDLTQIGSEEVSASEWYFGLVTALARQLDLATNEQEWWLSRVESGPVQRFNEFLKNIVLEEVREHIVVFIDEVDSTLKRRFTDDFFATIRAAYNARAHVPAYRRLAFVLLGVARPDDLIKDRTKTPYNIGVSVDIADFRMEELRTFREVFEAAYPAQGQEILGWILNWTSGQPYLTQKIGADLVHRQNSQIELAGVDAAVERLFLAEEARNETNLRSIRDRIRNNPYATKMLQTYRGLLRGKQIPNEERSVEQNELKLTGLIRVTPQGMLAVRNRLYARVFDESWVKANTPTNRTAIVAIGASVLAVVLLAMLVLNYINQQNQTAEIKAQTFIQQLQSSSPDVRLTGLAGLFSLGDQYAQQARDSFYGLSTPEKLAFFKLSTPQNVANELVAVVEGVYQKVDNAADGNALLASMSEILRQVGAAGAPSLTTEIEFWIQGRGLADRGQYETAINLYDRALSESERRNHANGGLYFDRALSYAALNQYDAALADFEGSIALDKERQSAAQNEIVNDPQLLAHWSLQSSKYPRLSAILPTETPTPTEIRITVSTLTSTTTPEPTQTSTPLPGPSFIPFSGGGVSTPTLNARTPTLRSPTPIPNLTPNVNNIELIGPPPGSGPYLNPITLTWAGALKSGQSYQARMYSGHPYGKQSLIVTSEQLSSARWTYSLPNWAVGEISWSVSIINTNDNIEISRSPQSAFWFTAIRGTQMPSP